MKTKISISVLMILISLGFIYTRNAPVADEKIISADPPAQQNPWLDTFYIGAMADEGNWNGNYTQLNTLGFNLWHTYLTGKYDVNTERWYPQTFSDRGFTDDWVLEPIANYVDDVNGITDDIYAANNGTKMIMMRPKIVYLCYGQRSDYQCEDDANIDNPDLWFYSFQNSIGTSVQDSGRMVLRCVQSTQGAGIVIKGLKANTEQCRRDTTNGIYGNQWEADNRSNWYIKPRIRIDSNFAHNNGNALVCKIIVKARDKSLIKAVDIKAINFINPVTGNYGGQYLEEFYFGPNDSDLIIRRDFATTGEAWEWAWNARGDKDSINIANHTDIQVYWYDNCDMWLDYIRVDNDVADGLMNPNSANFTTFNQWIEDETEQIGCHSINGVYPVMKFYMELCEFNNLPCMAYVNYKLKTYSSAFTSGAHTVDLLQDLQIYISYHVPYEERTTVDNAEFLNEHYIQAAGYTQIFTESYPLNACWTTTQTEQNFSKIPNTLPKTSYTKILAQAVSPASYDEWLQDMFNHKPNILEYGGGWGDSCFYGNNWLRKYHGNFRNRMQLGNQLAKLSGKPFIFMPQAHQWLTYNEVHREPTNEELDMMANVAVSYGVKGMLYFYYPSFNNGVLDNAQGITHGWGGNLIDTNYYHQTGKSARFQSIANRMTNKWGPTLLAFNDDYTNSYIYDFENERNTLLNPDNSYFKDVISFEWGTGPPPCEADNPETNYIPSNGYGTYECNEHRYLQVATFQKTNEDGNQYFMVINRRCSPLQSNHNDGQRNVVVMFHQNSAFFTTYTIWEIIDLASNTQVGTFKKNLYNEIIDLGLFNPGEGKLYKIAPVS